MADNTYNGGATLNIYPNISFLFSIISQEEIKYSSEITDHLVEDSSYIQDHIAIRPITYTLRGLVSEKTYTTPESIYFEVPSEPLASKLSSLAVLAPTVTSYVYSAITAVNTVKNRAEKLINVVKNAYSRVKRLGTAFSKGLNKTYYTAGNLGHKQWSDKFYQWQVLNILKEVMNNREPVEINTGWGMNLTKDYNYYITDVSMSQEDTYQQSTLVVTVKQLRFASTQLRKVTSDELSQTIFALQSMDAENAKQAGQEKTDFTSLAKRKYQEQN